MSDTYKILGQLAGTTTAETTAYTVPASTTAIISSFVVCNRESTATDFSLTCAIASTVTTIAQYLFRNQPIAAKETKVITLGATLQPNDAVRFQQTTAYLSLNIFGVEKA